MLEEMGIGGKARRQSFRVVDPVDPDDQRAIADAGGEPPHLPRCFRLCRLRRDSGDIDADREHRRPEGPAEGAQHTAAEVLAAGLPQQVIAKALQVGGGLKADEIVGAQRGDQIAMVGQQAHQLGRRKRRMEKKPDRLPAIELAQRRAERDQVIIVHPDEVARQQHRRQGAGEGAVDPEIAGEVAPRIADQRRPVVEWRPQHAVGVADVVFVIIAA